MSEETQQIADQTTEAPVVETPQAEEPKVHPAYEKVLAELPEAWHGKIIPHLQEQDKNFQKQLEQFTPFKSFIEDGISADTIKGGIDLANAINTNPLEVYSSIKEYLTSQGMLEEEAKAAAAQTMEAQTGENFEDIFDGEKVPAALQKEIDALKAKTEEVDSWKNQQEFAKLQAEAEAELESGMSALKQAHNITEAHEVAIYDLMNAALAAGREITVAQAAQQLQQMVGAFPAPTVGEPAPMIVGSAGGAGVPAMNTSIPKDDKGKKQMLAQMFDEYNRNNR
jgi:predicted nucleotidyltransferase